MKLCIRCCVSKVLGGAPPALDSDKGSSPQAWIVLAEMTSYGLFSQRLQCPCVVGLGSIGVLQNLGCRSFKLPY